MYKSSLSMIKEKQHINPTPENNQLYGGNKN